MLLCIFLLATSSAQDNTAGIGDWDDKGTWSAGGLPTDGNIILIPSGSIVTVRGTELELNNAILIIEGELIMAEDCGLGCSYPRLIFTGSESGVIVENGGKITDNVGSLGGSLSYVSVEGTKFWSADDCLAACGTYSGSTTFTETAAEPETLSNPLPVEMLSFTAHFTGTAVLLEWITTAEINNSHFVIERSVDGNEFDKIGKVPGTNVSTAQVSYSFLDDGLALISSRKVYYRLKQIDFDGQHEYSRIISRFSNTNPTAGLRVYPNPFTNRFSVSLTSPSEDVVKVALYHMEGLEVHSHRYPITEGFNKLIMSELADLPPGTYALYIIGNTISYKEKVIKLK